jgi:hypothetical protein
VYGEGGIEVSQGSYHLALTHDDDRPNAYDVTVASGSAASVELPGPYRLPTNPQANTPPSGTLGPGGFSAPEDPSEVADLQNQVAAAGSSAAAANAAHNANFLMLAQSPGNPETPGSPASEGSLQGSATMKDYVQSQIGTPESANPAAIAAGAAASVVAPSTEQPGFFGRIKQLVFGSGEPSQAALRAEEELRQRNREMQLNSGFAAQRAAMGIIHQEGMQRSLDGIDTAGEYLKGAVLTAVDQTPVGLSLAMREIYTDGDIEGNETSRPLAVLRVIANRIPAVKFGGGLLARVVNRVDDIGDGGRAFAKGHAFAKAPRRATGVRWGERIEYNSGTQTAMDHIKDGHFYNSRPGSRSSRFLENNSTQGRVKELVYETFANGKHTMNSRGEYSIVHTFDDVIGTDTNGRKTKTIQIFLDELGNVINAYPITRL